MNWSRISLRKAAPPRPGSKQDIPHGDCWHLNLDQIEGGTGRILSKIRLPAKESGNSTYWFDEHNVLYSKLRPYLNKVVCPDEPGIATTELVPLCPNTAILDRKFLTYYLRSSAFVRFATQTVAGAKMPRMIMPRFWEHDIPLPTLSEQRRIVEILDQADSLRYQRIDANKKADRILSALFHRMFGDPVTNPKGLRKRKLGAIIRVKSGDFLPAREMETAGPYAVYGGNGIAGRHTSFMFSAPVIVIGRVGQYCGAVHTTEPCSWVTDNALYVSAIDDDLERDYLAIALRLANLNQYAGRAAQPLISGSRIYPIEILVPEGDAQKLFVARARSLDDVLSKQHESSQAVDLVCDVLAHRAFEGRLTAGWREKHEPLLAAEREKQLRLIGNLPTLDRKRSRRGAEC